MSTEEAIIILQYNLEESQDELEEALEATEEIRMEFLF
jgi:hypothetical protein